MSKQPHRSEQAGAIQWDEEFDVVVVGFGAAGACAAIEAADQGARVLVIDRFSGGGATTRSGGVIYAGGGSGAQRAAGFKDTPAMMFDYLERETGGGVDKNVLRAFCETSAGTIAWLRTLGVRIPETFYPRKTTQPPGGYGLYFSGNEKHYSDVEPFPRGHVPEGTGMSGGSLFRALKRNALERNVTVRTRCRSGRLILNSGTVEGIQVLTLTGRAPARWIHAMLFNLGMIGGIFRKILSLFERAFSASSLVHARGGVIISAGGFVYNRSLMREYAPAYAGCMPLGTPGDDGGGIVLGSAAGAALASMNSCAASRFFCPPEAFVSGLLVNMRGERFCDESLYGATLSRHISAQPEGRAYLIVDEKLHQRAGQQMKDEQRLRDVPIARVLSGEMNALVFRRAMAFVNRRINRVRSDTVSGLEKKCGLPAGSLAQTIAAHNRRCEEGAVDIFGKATSHMEKIDRPHYYAINCRLDSRLFPSPCLTLGGLKVDGCTSQVLRGDDSPIPGLYAAGRSAAGVCSRSYVSGLSLADCIFSGRNAGRNAAERAGRESSTTLTGAAHGTL